LTQLQSKKVSNEYLTPLQVKLVEERGKGSHCTLEYGDRFTIIRNLKDELKTGTFNAMLKQLGISKNDTGDI